jgi:hypothetical protein
MAWSNLAQAAVESGIDGCLLTDLSVEEAEPYIHVMRQAVSIPYFWRRPPAARGAWNWWRNIPPALSIWFREPA